MMRRIDIAAFSACCLLVLGACSGDDDPDGQNDAAPDATQPDATSEPDGSDATPTDDEEPPEFQQAVSVAIEGEFASQVDLSEDATRVLPVLADAEFTVFADDDETAREDLSVAITDGDGDELEPKEENFRNGLWRVTVELGPGTVVSATVADEAGNTAESDAQLTIPTRRDALVDSWQRRSYDAEQSITERWDRQMNDDGTWEESRESLTLGGTFEVTAEGDVERLELAETYREGGDSPDSDRETVERKVVSSYYVDNTYFDHRAWTRGGDAGDGLAGTWSREYTVHKRQDDQLQVAREVSETLEFEEVSDGDNTWTLTRTGTDHTGSEESAIDESESGTWERIENESYAGNYGDFLVRETTQVDGEPVETPESVTELYTMPLDRLLISPYLRSPEAD